MTDSAVELARTSHDHFRLSRRELMLIVAFWSVYAVLTVASRMFDRGGGGGAQEWPSVVAVAVAEALCWMLLTPLLFLLAARLDAGHGRATRIVVFAVIGVTVAGLLGVFGTALRHAVSPAHAPFSGSGIPDDIAGVARGRGRGGPPRGGGPSVWFGILNALVLYLGVVSAGLARTLSRRYHLRREEAARREARLEGQLAEARLDALRRQLDPHFLFNTLNAVSALVERDPRGVRRMIMRLSELLRHSFEGAGEAQVSLRAELALINRYVEIMQVRFQGRLTVQAHIEGELLDALVPNMILQPLVENAIKHGVERTRGPESIAIEAERAGEQLVLRVRDDGPGVGDAFNASGQRGVGLRNTIARLEQLYGADERFSIRPGVDGGTVVELRLPYRVASNAAESSPTSAGRGVVAGGTGVG